MDSPLTPEKQNVVIEDALQTYPIAAMPRSLTADVIGRIQTIPAPRPFHLAWTDLMLGAILALCVVAIWFSVENLPPIVVAQIRKEIILFYQYVLVNARWLVPVISFGVAALISALTLPYLRQELIKKS